MEQITYGKGRTSNVQHKFLLTYKMQILFNMPTKTTRYTRQQTTMTNSSFTSSHRISQSFSLKNCFLALKITMENTYILSKLLRYIKICLLYKF